MCVCISTYVISAYCTSCVFTKNFTISHMSMEVPAVVRCSNAPLICSWSYLPVVLTPYFPLQSCSNLQSSLKLTQESISLWRVLWKWMQRVYSQHWYTTMPRFVDAGSSSCLMRCTCSWLCVATMDWRTIKKVYSMPIYNIVIKNQNATLPKKHLGQEVFNNSLGTITQLRAKNTLNAPRKLFKPTLSPLH